MCRPKLILEQSRRLAQITQDISDMSLPQSSAPDWLDLNGLLRRACHFVSFDRRFSAIQFDCDLDDRLPALYAVGDHLTQVVLNLLFNAADAIGDRHAAGGRIRVATRAADGRLVLTLADNGTGIAADLLERVFDEFYTTKPNGTGVGLAVSRHLIRQAGGDITVTSRPGEGSVFSVSLPLAAAAE
jgi:signal transduction histidine kinase